MLAIGTELGPYQILAPLGQGGMGEVYRAKDLRLDREVAVKVLPEPFAHDPKRRARFEREARAVAALSHPNILAIHDYGTHGAVTYAVMELLEGETLRSRMAERPLPWREAIEVGGAVADGLAAAHAKGIVHRDIKPENLFLTSDSRVKILDFGLARVETTPPVGSETGPYLPAQTDPGTVMGTIGYMSPEQVRGLVVDGRSDLFSLGCVLYEMVAGRRPFQRKTAADTTAAILHDEPRELADLGVQVPRGVEHAIRLCLAKRPEDRFPSAHDCASALRALLSGSEVSPPLPPTKPLFQKRRRRPRKAPDSLAVLPLFNASDDADMDYLSDGITESIISTLSQLPKLRVMARNTVFRFKGRDADACAVGRELNVRAVLTGRMLQRGDRLILRAELVDTADGAQLWGEQYNRPLADLLAVEEEMAREIVGRLRLRLTEPQRRRLHKRRTENVDAYQLYLQGRLHWNKRTEEAIGIAIACFEKSIAQAPGFALGYAGLADCYALLPYYGSRPPREAFPIAAQMATKALALDDTLAEAHTALAFISAFYDWDWVKAERENRRALELCPSDAMAHHRYGYCLMVLGRFEEASRELDRARELDPLSLLLHANIGFCSYLARRYEHAIAQLQQTLAVDVNFPTTHYQLGLAYEQKGLHEQAIAELHKALALCGSKAECDYPALGHAYAVAGRRDDARKVLDELVNLSKLRYVPPSFMALICLGLGETDQAFQWLEKAYHDRDLHLIYLKVDPRFDTIRSDRRFKALLRHVGFPTEEADDRPIDSLAILPLINADADPNMDYLSDGISENLINLLSRLPRLRVMARSTVFRYKGRDIDAQEVGRVLNVRAVLLGRVSQRDHRVIIKTELVDVADGSQLWGEHYHRELSDLFAVETAIAQEIAGKLRLHLTGEQKRRLGRPRTENAEAYQCYLKGRYHWNKRSAEALKKSIKLFEQAIDIDPTYALAYTGVADAYLNLGGWGHLPSREAYPHAKAAATRAVALDDTLAEAHVSLAMVQKEYDWDWTGAGRGYERALELNPNYAVAYQWYGEYLAALGRHPEAVAAFRRAIELDPLSLIIHATLGRHGYYFARQYDQAIAHLQKTLAMDESFWVAHLWLGWTYANIGRLDEALAEIQEARRLDDNLEIVAALGYTYGRLARRLEAQQVLDGLQQLSSRRYVSPMLSALIAIGMGDHNPALGWLEQACEDRAQMMSELQAEPAFDPLRTDPRFAELLRRVGLETTAPAAGERIP